jgi:hypothetical protein
MTATLIQQLPEEDKLRFSPSVGNYANHSWKHYGVEQLRAAGFDDAKIQSSFTHHNSLSSLQNYGKTPKETHADISKVLGQIKRLAIAIFFPALS